MRIPFVGGPYDGREIAHDDLSRHAHLLVERGDLGERAFALMPPPDEWERTLRDEPATAGPLTPYEREDTGDGWWYRAVAGEELVRANLEARLKVSDSARFALDQLGDELRRAVVRQVSTLSRDDPRVRSEFLPIHVPGQWPLHPVRVGPRWLAFVRFTPNAAVELFDVVREDVLGEGFARFRTAGPTR